ncbi:Glycosyltransferase, GT2 family [Nitrosomonas cryotolerans]|uniref:Glycosyltransferase, GT2 family n=1 Tax=Nitrosomonas cryotolerans ATCC 49181 TaxID=1131553 RepID=A0A1N6FT21_9PROT|nr:glycosyltransferase family 2 protein [Nitrosomonas cryotolerans]SFP76944.1 Glycosyltransferase, GT2 family [Nitrosomonas cryotolerans]SIN98469.1 Glycosyltransferase, GT2 family [Nitrosomonas cryotolerans ATCC 49181]
MTNVSGKPSIDVIIPVYNAPALTRRCIDSVVAYLSPSIRYIYIQDDASDIETREMLDQLPYADIHIYHAQRNQGFGMSVNEAVARSNADFVLILNSDTEMCADFLPVLYATFVADPQLAIVSPAQDGFTRYDVNRYLRRPGGYIPVYHYKGYAFLIRRSVFSGVGGFDPKFGRGYFEDMDLSRRLNQQNWRMGVHPDTRIYHRGGGSFGRGQVYRSLMQHNRGLYLSCYPDVRRNIVLVSDCCDLPDELHNAIEDIFRQGGNVHWLTSVPVPKLSCLQMRNSRTGLVTIVRLMLRGCIRNDKRISAVWILPGIPYALRGLLAIFVYLRKLEVILWKT